MDKDDRDRYAREKLWQAVETLVGDGPIQTRLTYAADYLLRIMPDKHLPAGKQRTEFEEIKNALTSEPLSTATGYSPRHVTPEEGAKLARRILSLYTELRGGI
jgi:hypothetical protein